MPLTPTFAGMPLFGASFSVKTMLDAPRWQFNSYPGVNGIEGLFLGNSGGQSAIEFLLIGADEGDLNGQKNTLWNLQDSGMAYTLTDSLGESWLLVILMGFEPVEDIQPCLGGISQKQRATFKHLLA